MPTVVTCPACQRPLRVAEELLGRTVRCPSCREVFTGQTASDRPADTPPAPSEGVTTLPPDQPSNPATPAPADPEAIPCPSCQTPNSRMLAVCHNCGFDLDEAAAEAEAGTDRPWEHRRGPDNVRRDCEPHRGTLVLVLGIISLVFTGIIGLPFGIVAWIMGQRDLRKIQAGEMDPSGEATTRAGQVCGIVGTVLGTMCGVATLAYLVFWIILMVFISSGPIRPMPVPPTPPATGAVKPPATLRVAPDNPIEQPPNP